jgi:hypothetical protein
VPKPLVEFCNKPMIVHQIEVRASSLAVQQDSLHSSKLRANAQPSRLPVYAGFEKCRSDRGDPGNQLSARGEA